MKFWTSVASMVVVCAGFFLASGCGPTNEEELKGKSEVKAHVEGTPDFKTYSEAMQHQAKEQAKNQGKAKKSQ